MPFETNSACRAYLTLGIDRPGRQEFPRKTNTHWARKNLPNPGLATGWACAFFWRGFAQWMDREMAPCRMASTASNHPILFIVFWCPKFKNLEFFRTTFGCHGKSRTTIQCQPTASMGGMWISCSARRCGGVCLISRAAPERKPGARGNKFRKPKQKFKNHISGILESRLSIIWKSHFRVFGIDVFEILKSPFPSFENAVAAFLETAFQSYWETWRTGFTSPPFAYLVRRSPGFWLPHFGEFGGGFFR